MLDEKTIEVVKSIAPILQKRGLEITQVFYETMFERNPEVKEFFDMEKQKSGEQPKALAMTILAAAKNIDNLGCLAPVVSKIGEIHCDKMILPEHYPIVGENLLIAIKKVLKDDASDEVIEAWGKAYEQIAKVFIDVEDKIYKDRCAK